jgi:hypothetical protein
MRKVLIVAFGLASLGALGNVQPASALDFACFKVANADANRCQRGFDGTVTTCNFVQDIYDRSYNKCLVDKAERQQAAKQQKQNYITNAQNPTGILGAGKPLKRVQ